MKINKIILFTFLALVMALSACSNFDETIVAVNPTGEQVILFETFANDLGKFTTQSVTGNQVWAFSTSGYALISGFVSPANFANEDWLISPDIDLTTVTAAHFSFDHVARYFGNAETEATIWVSENYNNTDSLPRSATWTQIPTTTFVDPGSWPNVLPSTGQISLTAYAGKKIKIALKYISTATKAGTWELKNFLVERGEAVNIVGNSGKEAAPFTVSEAVKNLGSAKYVKGYVVGYVWSGRANSTFFNVDTCTQVANLIISDSFTDVYISKCLVVQLPVGVVRDSLNLKNWKSKLFGKEIIVYGTLGTSTLGLSEMSNTSYFVLPSGSTGGVKPVEPILSETFATSFGLFTKVSVLGDQGWGISFGSATMTGFVSSVNNANEDWLISPQIDLTDITAAKLSFDHVIRYCTNPVIDGTIWVSEDYVSGLPSTGTWIQLPTSVFKDPNSWTFSNIGPISLAPYANKKIKFAFKYLSTTTKAGTWEIKNVSVLK